MEGTRYVISAAYCILNGRAAGATLRQQILQFIHQQGWERLYYVDFANVEFLDFSCADELVRGLLDDLVAREGGTRNVVLRGTSQPVRENIAAVLELRKSVCLSDDGRGG